MDRGAAPWTHRTAAAFVDVVAVLAYGVLLFAATLALAGGIPGATDPVRGQLVGLGTMTLPVVLGFAVLEAGSRGATPGKRALGLRLVDVEGGPVPLRRCVLRSALRFAPWELGHFVAHQAYAGNEAMWLIAPAVLATAVPVLWLGLLVHRGVTPYDRWTRTLVVRDIDPEGSGN